MLLNISILSMLIHLCTWVRGQIFDCNENLVIDKLVVLCCSLYAGGSEGIGWQDRKPSGCALSRGGKYLCCMYSLLFSLLLKAYSQLEKQRQRERNVPFPSVIILCFCCLCRTVNRMTERRRKRKMKQSQNSFPVWHKNLALLKCEFPRRKCIKLHSWCIGLDFMLFLTPKSYRKALLQFLPVFPYLVITLEHKGRKLRRFNFVPRYFALPREKPWTWLLESGLNLTKG